MIPRLHPIHVTYSTPLADMAMTYAQMYIAVPWVTYADWNCMRVGMHTAFSSQAAITVKNNQVISVLLILPYG
jgi:hypothetical protein